MTVSKLPEGSSWSNPIWYKDRWRIYQSEFFPGQYAYVHDDYDGAEDAGDFRHGRAISVESCKAEIDEWIADHNG